MGDIYYKAIMKDGDHLVRSRENPNRFRGLSRDAYNKNQNFIELEPVDSSELMHQDTYAMSQRYEIEKLEMALMFTERLLDYLASHPEVVEAGVKAIVKFGGIVASGTQKAYGSMKKFIRNKVLKKEATTLKRVDNKKHTDRTVKMSADEYREKLLRFLKGYLVLQRELEQLRHAEIEEEQIAIMDMDDVLACLERYIKECPELVDDVTERAILELFENDYDIHAKKDDMSYFKY